MNSLAATSLAKPTGATTTTSLPPLREDLRLYEGPPDADGSPTWTIGDPVRGRYFYIGYTAFHLLGKWHLADPAQVLAAVNMQLVTPVGLAELEDMLFFLRANNLIAGHAPGQVQSFLAQVQAQKLGWLQWLLHNYLFIRIPLVRPDRFLARTLPWVAPLLSRGFLLIIVTLGLLGLLLITRRWDEFSRTFPYFFSLEGAALLGATLVFAKIIHELGHAFMAKRFGCRVHSMGVAFMVMVPVLFTDVSDAWRLPSRSQRLLIDAGGMLAELSLAAVATLLWSFLPDGPLRSAAFMLATVTWVTTVLVNINPLMRFDGYFLLSDLLGIQNLQQRGFALARWQLREWLFAFGEPPPEVLQPKRQSAVLIWAYCTWVYRFFLFTGIALVVYHAFFKLLGIALMAVELGWFVSAPLLREFKAWWARRHLLRHSRRGRFTAVGALLLLAALIIPWQDRVALPAIIEAADYTVLYPPAPAQIAAIHVISGATVRAGQALYTLAAPDLDYKLARASQQLELIQREIMRQAASRETLGQLGVLESQLAANLAEVRGLREQQKRLIVRAPNAGVLTDVPPSLRPGLWLAETSMLGRVVGREHARLRGYVRATDLNRIEVGAAGKFYPEDPARPAVPVRVTKIEGIGVSTLDVPYLASTYGGAVAVRDDRERGAVPTESLYRVVLTPTQNDVVPEEVRRGTVRVEAESVSPLIRLWRLTLATLIRESGF